MIEFFSQEQVQVREGLFRKRMELNKQYLKELDNTCLLQNYYLEAGEIMPGLFTLEDPSKANLHWGWEAPTCQLRGHFLGHYLSAAAAIVANESDYDSDGILSAKVKKIIFELRKCQLLNGGKWAGPIPEKYFEELTTDRYVWSPQYTIHKLLMGLLDVYKYTNNEEALEILSGMADWFLKWTGDMKKRCPDAVFKGEQAGMLELWADAYMETNDERFRQLAETYKDQKLFDRIKTGNDALTDDHANASIPIIQGAAKMYEMTGNTFWKDIVEAFWKIAVTDRGMYATTGANAGEFWIPPMKLGEYRGDRNQEFCTVYNMVRVAEYLFKWTGDPQYSDYIERCLYNGFLAQQNPETGMPTYFLPLTTGSMKKWATKRNDFWCCQGTMIQAQTKYPELIYASDYAENRLYVNQYIPSTLNGSIGLTKIVVDQSLSMSGYEVQTLFDEYGSSEKARWKMRFHIVMTPDKEITISFRRPEWAAAEPGIMINGIREESKTSQEDGYINVRGCKNGDVIEISFKSELRAERLPDMPYQAAFLDGPIVLAGITEDVDVIEGDFDKPSEFMDAVTEHTYETFIWLQNNYRTKRQKKNFKLIPLYDVKDEAYTLYFEEKK